MLLLCASRLIDLPYRRRDGGVGAGGGGGGGTGIVVLLFFCQLFMTLTPPIHAVSRYVWHLHIYDGVVLGVCIRNDPNEPSVSAYYALCTLLLRINSSIFPLGNIIFGVVQFLKHV